MAEGERGEQGGRVAPAAQPRNSQRCLSFYSTVYLAYDNELPTAPCSSYWHSRQVGLRGSVAHEPQPWGAG